MKKIFIDGKAGTTGLRIYERLADRKDIDIILLSEEERKNPIARKNALNSCDIAFLCLPDDAARESVSMVENDNVVLIDTSTAHRTLEGWCYGFPELSAELDNKLKSAKTQEIIANKTSEVITKQVDLMEKELQKAFNESLELAKQNNDQKYLICSFLLKNPAFSRILFYLTFLNT